MALEGRILLYYLKVFSIASILFFILVLSYSFYILNKKNLQLNKTLIVSKNESLDLILNKNLNDFSKIDISLIKLFYKLNKLITHKFIHYGNFNIDEDASVIDLLNIISKPSNIIKKITIVEGWSHNDFNKEVSKVFKDINIVPYEKIIADTYFLEDSYDFKSFIEKITITKNNYFKKFINHEIYKTYSIFEIMTIGSLIEKEGLDYEDKRKISSVILNRLKKNMRLQIDATVLYALTNGNYNLQRKLLISDLKFNHAYNTYTFSGLPPGPISYVGKNTLDIIFENYKTDFLFYFFDKSLNRHIFSKTFEEHKDRLNEYRKN